jgi:predicted phage gp36 major capsid-like protein
VTIDERLEALTRNLELMIVETEKHDQQMAVLASESAERSEKNDRQIAAMLGQSAGQDGRLVRVGALRRSYAKPTTARAGNREA